MLDRTLEELWETAPPAAARFDPARITHLPRPVRRYLEHTLAPGTPLSTTARLTMHGTIRVSDAWHPFSAEQVIRWDRGFVWRGRATMKGLPVRGSDRLLDGEGSMRWKLLGIVPVATGSGPEVTRSAAGRLHAEAIWLPGVLLGDDVRWTALDEGHAHATVRAHGEPSELDLTIHVGGALAAISLPRWGEHDGAFAYQPFGGTCDGDRRFGGVTIPTTYRLGWYFGTPRYEREGEFFRCTIDSLEHR